ncbi:MAG: winged helix-turn-helix domain-containing protein [Bryobacterales bacterium]|nr:winged helix-turn-helix domain-containing protein [Bryobacterales bacterium]
MIHQFGPFQYDAEQRVLFRDGEPQPLAPKAIDTLHVLVERRGRVVEKAELMKLVWPDTMVEDVGLARNISLLRKALGDEGLESAYIETVPRRGYRFVAESPSTASAPPEPVSPSELEFPGAAAVPADISGLERRPRWLLPACVLAVAALVALIYWQFYVPSRFISRQPGIASLAVVPFEALNGDGNPQGFAEGLTDSLVSSISKLEGVHVISPSTVRRHQWVGISMGLMGRLLGLDVLVEGSVREAGERLRITARLVDVRTGKVIWSETYDRPRADPGQVESQIAGEIATQVGLHLAIHSAVPEAR